MHEPFSPISRPLKINQAANEASCRQLQQSEDTNDSAITDGSINFTIFKQLQALKYAPFKCFTLQFRNHFSFVGYLEFQDGLFLKYYSRASSRDRHFVSINCFVLKGKHLANYAANSYGFPNDSENLNDRSKVICQTEWFD